MLYREVESKIKEHSASLEHMEQEKVDKDIINTLQTQISNIGSGSPKGAFATLIALQNDVTANTTEGKKNIYVVTSDGGWYYWNGTAWSKGGTYQATISSEFTATNIVPNSDFSNGLSSGWLSVNSASSVTNKVLKNVADGTAIYGLIKNDLTNLVVGHKYYFKGRVKVTNSNCDYISLRVNNSSESQYLVNNPIINNLYDINGIFTATSTTSAINFTHKYADATVSKDKVMELQYVLGIDLTDIFGSGNEPTTSEVNILLSNYPNSWFVGTVSPFVDNKDLYNRVYKINTKTLASKTIQGTNNQIKVVNGDGVASNPILSIPEGATEIFRPLTPTVSYGSELAPNISTWTGGNGSVWNGTSWIVPELGTLKTNITVEQGAEYQIDVTWTDTSNYNFISPRLIVKLGTAISDKQFVGYSDALYKLTIVANESGNVEIKLGDGIEKWSATITNISIKKIVNKVSKAGRIGLGVFDIYTGGTSFAVGGGHARRTSGTDNTAIGYIAQRDLTTGNYNSAIGAYAQQSLTTGLNNVGLGFMAQRYMKTGYYNIGIGYSAQSNLEFGSWNIAIGNECMRDSVSTDWCTAVGSRAFNSLVSGQYNVAIGRQAGFYPKSVDYPTTSANNQTNVGSRSGQSSSVQANNLTTLGYSAIGTTNATSLGAFAEAKGVGSVAIGLDSEGNFAQANNDNEFVLGTSKHNVKVKGTLNLARYTPTSSADARGQIGDVTSDDSYIYTKTSTGWKRSALSTW